MQVFCKQRGLKMKLGKRIWIIPIAAASFLLFEGGFSDSKKLTAANVSEYQNGDQYRILVLPTNHESTSDLQRMAHEKATQLAVEHGCSSYTVKKEGMVNVIASDRNKSSQPTDLYYEKIQNDDFSSNSLDENGPSSTQSNGYQLIIQLCPSAKN